MAEIIDFASKKLSEAPAPKLQPGKFEFHLHPVNEEVPGGETVTAEGYLKFGPAFVAVVDGPEDTANVSYAVATGLLMYVKRLGDSGEIEATLSPGG